MENKRCANPHCTGKASNKGKYCSHYCAKLISNAKLGIYHTENNEPVKPRVIENVRLKNGRLETRLQKGASTKAGKRFYWGMPFPEFISCCLPYD